MSWHRCVTHVVAPHLDGSGSGSDSGGMDGSGSGSGSGGMDGSGYGSSSGSTGSGSGSGSGMGSGTTLPGEEGGGRFDTSNPACQELARRGLVNGRRGDFWNELFDRDRSFSRQRYSYPNPEDPDYADAPAAICGADGPAGGYTSGARCRTPVLCAEGSALDSSCSCSSSAFGARPLRSTACATVNCAEGTVPVPIGAVACECQPQGGRGPAPGNPRDPIGGGGGFGGGGLMPGGGLVPGGGLAPGAGLPTGGAGGFATGGGRPSLSGGGRPGRGG